MQMIRKYDAKTGVGLAVKLKIKKGDEVVVISGKSKGQKGVIKQVHVAEGRVVVEGVNLVSKMQKPNPSKQEQGGIIKKEAPLHVSNVAVFNPSTGKPDRVG